MSDLSNRCRLCLKNTKNKINFIDNNELLSKMLICLPVVCSKKVNDFYQFWRVVAHNNEFFKHPEETSSVTSNTDLITSIHSYSRNPSFLNDSISINNTTETNKNVIVENIADNDELILNGDINSPISNDISNPNINHEDSIISENNLNTNTVKSTQNVHDDEVTILDYINCNNNNNNNNIIII